MLLPRPSDCWNYRCVPLCRHPLCFCVDVCGCTWQPETDGCFSQLPATCFFEAGSLTDSGAGQQAPGILQLQCPIPQSRERTACLAFCMHPVDSNSCRACAASIFPTAFSLPAFTACWPPVSFPPLLCFQGSPHKLLCPSISGQSRGAVVGTMGESNMAPIKCAFLYVRGSEP